MGLFICLVDQFIVLTSVVRMAPRQQCLLLESTPELTLPGANSRWRSPRPLRFYWFFEYLYVGNPIGVDDRGSFYF